MTTLAITGVAGRMGGRLVALARQDGQLKVVDAVERADAPQLGRDVGEVAGIGAIGLPVSTELKDTPQVLIDFTVPAGMRHWLKVCQQRGIAMVVGTTGLQPSDHALIDEAATRIPVLQAPNMSLGVNLLFKIA